MKRYLLIIALPSILLACNSETNYTEELVINQIVDHRLTPERIKKTKLIFESVPTPMETVSIFQSIGATYNSEITNSPRNINNYSTSSQLALNLGVYGADLSYANIFNAQQESDLFMNCSKKMADELGISKAFSNEILKRIEENKNNKDSMHNIIDDAFWLADSQLKNNGQHSLSALVITGGWVEALYLGINSLDKKNPNKIFMEKIANQKQSLDGLIELLATYENGEVYHLSQKIARLKTVYDKIEVDKDEFTIIENRSYGSNQRFKYDEKTIFEIEAIIKNIRTEIVS